MPNTSKPSHSECPSEHWEQSQFVSWWRKTQPDMIFAIPNGGKRGPAQAARLRLEGVLPGVWDLFAPERGLWIEFKRVGKGVLSTEQRKFGEKMLGAGYRCLVAYGYNDAVAQIEHGERGDWSRPKPQEPNQ